jgi:hypothetical protein
MKSDEQSKPTIEPEHVELDELEVPVVSMHPAFGGARVGPDGALRVRTNIRAGSCGNIVQCYPLL